MGTVMIVGVSAIVSRYKLMQVSWKKGCKMAVVLVLFLR